MPAQAVSPSQLQKLSGSEAGNVKAILANAGFGAALYVSDQGQNLVLSYGTWKAQIPGQCPSNYGDMTLRAYCPPKGSDTQEMVSPLLRGRQQQEDIPQIPTRLFGPPSQTIHAGDRVGMSAATTPLVLEPEPEPTTREIMQERPPVEPPPPEPPNGPASWWDRLGKRMSG